MRCHLTKLNRKAPNHHIIKKHLRRPHGRRKLSRRPPAVTPRLLAAALTSPRTVAQHAHPAVPKQHTSWPDVQHVRGSNGQGRAFEPFKGEYTLQPQKKKTHEPHLCSNIVGEQKCEKAVY
ncbi:hypothetical protein MRX96_017729 [Rhipicephalus microplus]